eukprot:jgi/Botrbrau1/18697/Bobra.0386s0023.1
MAAGPIAAGPQEGAVAPAPADYALAPQTAQAGIQLPLPQLDGIPVLGLPPLQGMMITVNPGQLLAPLTAPVEYSAVNTVPIAAAVSEAPTPAPGTGPEPFPRPLRPLLPGELPQPLQGRRLLQEQQPAPAPAPGLDVTIGPLPLPLPLPLPAIVPNEQVSLAPADAPLAAAPDIPIQALGPVDQQPRAGAIATLPSITIPILGNEAIQLPALPLQRLTMPVPAMAPAPRGAPMIEVGNVAGVFGAPTEGPVLQPDGPALSPNDPAVRVQNPFDTSQGVTIAGR